MKKNALLATGLSLGLLGASPLAAAEFKDWDGNNDGQLTQQEFDAGVKNEGLFADWDGNDDGLLDETEFGKGAFGVYDGNDDGFLDDSEWEEQGLFDI